MLASSLVLLLLLTSFGLTFAFLDLLEGYQDSVDESAALDWGRANESAYVSPEASSVVSGTRQLNLSVVNDGFIEVKIRFLGLFNLTSGDNYYEEVGSPSLVEPGETLSIVSTISLPLNHTTKDFEIQLVTARGSLLQILLLQGEFLSPTVVAGQGTGGTGTGPGGSFPKNLLISATSTVNDVDTFDCAGVPITLFVNATSISSQDMTDVTFTITMTDSPPGTIVTSMCNTPMPHTVLFPLIQSGETIGFTVEISVTSSALWVKFTVTASGAGVQADIGVATISEIG